MNYVSDIEHTRQTPVQWPSKHVLTVTVEILEWYAKTSV